MKKNWQKLRSKNLQKWKQFDNIGQKKKTKKGEKLYRK